MVGKIGSPSMRSAPPRATHVNHAREQNRVHAGKPRWLKAFLFPSSISQAESFGISANAVWGFSQHGGGELAETAGSFCSSLLYKRRAASIARLVAALRERTATFTFYHFSVDGGSTHNGNHLVNVCVVDPTGEEHVLAVKGVGPEVRVSLSA